MGISPNADFFEKINTIEVKPSGNLENISVNFPEGMINLPVLNNSYNEEDDIPPEPKGLDIHLFQSQGKYFLYDIVKGASFEIDKPTYDVLNSFKDEGREDILVADDELINLSEKIGCTVNKLYEICNSLFELKSEGYLSPYVNRGDSLKFPPMNLGNIELHVINACNLRCGYCFAGDGDYGYHGKNAWMTEEVAEQAVMFLMRTSTRKNVSIVFFGGEPLLNLKLMRHVAAYATEKAKEFGKAVSYSVTTNATLLTDDAIEFLNKNNVSVLVSIDGGKETQDSQRPSTNGKSSYDQMIDGLKKFIVSRRGKVSARVTVTSKNMDFLKTSKELEEIGFGQVYFSPASVEEGSRYFLGKEENDKFYEEFEKLSLSYIEKQERGEKSIRFQTLIAVAEDILAESKHERPCGAGLGTVAVDPSGNIFPCHRFVGTDVYAIGNVIEGIDPEKRNIFVDKAMHNQRIKCSRCWVRNLCAGGCINELMDSKGEMRVRPEYECAKIRKEFELGLALSEKLKTINILGRERFNYSGKAQS
jgi:uncharacterized protein